MQPATSQKREFLGINDEIILEYLPAYIPELNPIEIRRANGQVFESVDATKTTILKMSNTNESTVVKTFDCLIC